MRALIVLAHGSRRRESSKEVEEMALQLQESSEKDGKFDIVKAAFMQFCGPGFYEVVDEILKSSASDEGSKEFIILPYFISAGNHVAEDIPQLVREASVKYPDINFKLTSHLGKFNGLGRLILDETPI